MYAHLYDKFSLVPGPLTAVTNSRERERDKSVLSRTTPKMILGFRACEHQLEMNDCCHSYRNLKSTNMALLVPGTF